MKPGGTDRFARGSPGPDFQDARGVAEHLGFPFYVLGTEEEFRRAVLEDFVAECSEGRTPVPASGR